MSASEDDAFAPAKDRRQTLRTAFALAVAEILDAGRGDEGGNDTGGNSGRLPISKAAAQQLTEVAWSWTTTALAPDLERFAKHAKRSKVAPEDVLLAARKNEVTHNHIVREMKTLKAASGKRQKVTETSAL